MTEHRHWQSRLNANAKRSQTGGPATWSEQFSVNLLLVEDDPMLGRAIAAGLKRHHVVEWLMRGDEALLWLGGQTVDAIILDIKLPDMTGFDILRELRRAQDGTPVLLLTALDSVAHRIQGLDAGADDYLVKPFDLGELEARLRALIRRRNGRVSPILQARDIQLDPAARVVKKNGAPVTLSAKEFDILLLLLENAGRVMRRSDIEERIYALDQAVESNAVEVHISSIRRKLGRELIATMRGSGYIIRASNGSCR